MMIQNMSSSSDAGIHFHPPRHQGQTADETAASSVAHRMQSRKKGEGGKKNPTKHPYIHNPPLLFSSHLLSSLLFLPPFHIPYCTHTHTHTQRELPEISLHILLLSVSPWSPQPCWIHRRPCTVLVTAYRQECHSLVRPVPDPKSKLVRQAGCFTGCSLFPSS